MADAGPATFLTTHPLAPVHANAGPAAHLTLAPEPIMLTSGRPATLPASFPLTIMLADALATAFSAVILLSPMRTLRRSLVDERCRHFWSQGLDAALDGHPALHKRQALQNSRNFPGHG